MNVQQPAAVILALLLILAPIVAQEPAAPGSTMAFPEKLLEGTADFNLALLVHADIRGSYGPGGWGANPMGGFARRVSYWNAFARKYPARPLVRIDGGSLFAVAVAESGLVNRYILEGTYRSGLDAVNLTSWDIPGWRELVDLAAAGKVPRQLFDVPLVSANVKAKVAGFPVIHPYVVRELVLDDRTGKKLRLGITGLLYDPGERISRTDFDVERPEVAVRRVIDQMREKCDYSVVLTDSDIGRAISLAVLVPAINLMVVAHDYEELAEPQQVGNTLITIPANQGRYVTEVRLALNPASQEMGVTARFVPLDRTIPDDPAMRELIRKARTAVEELLRP